MGLPDKRREADELVEPLFAGLSGAEEQSEAARSESDSENPPADPWKHPHAPRPLAAGSDSRDAEPATLPLLLKALLLLIVLCAIGAFVYLTVGV